MVRLFKIGFVKENTKAFELIQDFLAHELFGLSLINMIRTLLIFLNACLLMIMFLKLRSNNELLEIKNNLITIESINNKELKYFNADNNYIETEDAIAMGIKLKRHQIEEKVDYVNRKGTIESKKKKVNSESVTERTNRKLIVQPYEIENKDFYKIIEFIKNENEDYDNRMKKNPDS